MLGCFRFEIFNIPEDFIRPKKKVIKRWNQL